MKNTKITKKVFDEPKPEKREPLECWVTFQATENLVEDEIQTDEVFDHDQSDYAIRHAKRLGYELAFVREVTEPEVKELPDSEGVWWNWSSPFPFRVYRDDQGKLGYDTVTGYHHSGVKGRWIKVENPHQKAGE